MITELPQVVQRDNNIPHRNSEMHTYSLCPQKWYWQYIRDIEPKRFHPTIHRGTMGHIALAATRMFQANNINVPTAEEAARRLHGTVEQLTPYEYADFILYKWVEEFSEKRGLFDEEVEPILSVYTGVGEQNRRYHDWWGAWDEVLLTEHEIKVNFDGKQVAMRLDGVVRDGGLLWVLESKWVKGFRTLEAMDLDAQMSLYILGARSIGYDVEGVIADQVAPIPKTPQKTQSGDMSRAKVGDKGSYTRALLEAKLDPNKYLDVLEKLPDTAEFRRDKIVRSEHHLGMFVKQFSNRMSIFEQPAFVYLNEDRMRCPYCPFSELCNEYMNGGDVESIIQADYISRSGGEIEPTEQDNLDLFVG